MPLLSFFFLSPINCHPSPFQLILSFFLSLLSVHKAMPPGNKSVSEGLLWKLTSLIESNEAWTQGGRKRSADWEHLMNIESTIFSLFLTNTHTQIGAGKHVHISKDMYSASECSQSFSLLWYLLISKSTLTSILTNMTNIVLLWVMLAGFHIISEIIAKKMLTIEILKGKEWKLLKDNNNWNTLYAICHSSAS